MMQFYIHQQSSAAGDLRTVVDKGLIKFIQTVWFSVVDLILGLSLYVIRNFRTCDPVFVTSLSSSVFLAHFPFSCLQLDPESAALSRRSPGTRLPAALS